MPHTDDYKWMCRMQADLESQEEDGPRDGPRDGPATIFRVPPVLRELDEESYSPKCFSFGLYHRRNSWQRTICLEFLSVFKEITQNSQKDWRFIYSKVMEGKSVKDWMGLYDGIKLGQFEEKDVEEKVATEEPEAFRAWEETAQRFLAWDAIFVVCFLLADHLRNCRSTCQRNFLFLGSLTNKIEKKEVAPQVSMIRLDIFKFENQIPLGLIKNVFNMISSMYTDRPSMSTSTPDTDHKLNFHTFVTNAVCSIYCDLPHPLNIREFKLTMKELNFEERTHLLECLYSVVCYRPRPSRNQGTSVRKPRETVSMDVENQGTIDSPQSSNGGDGGSRSQGTTGAQDDNGKSPHDDGDPSRNSSGGGRDGTSGGKSSKHQKGAQPVTEIGRPSAAARDVEKRDGDQQPTGGTPQSGNIGGHRVMAPTSGNNSNKRNFLRLASSTSVRKPRETVSDDVENQGATDPPQSSNTSDGGSRSQGTTGAQEDKGKSPQDDADPPQNSSGGGRDGTSGGLVGWLVSYAAGAQRDKGKSPQGDADPLQNSNGGGGDGPSGGAQRDKGKSPQGDVDPRQSSNGGGVEGTRGTQDEKGKSPQGDADPPQSSNGGRGEGTSAAQHDRVKSLQVDRLSAQMPNSDGGAASRNGCANLVEWMFTSPTICQGSQTHRNGQRRHIHTQGGIPTITELKFCNIAVKREGKTNWMSEVNFRTSILNYKGELYLPEFAVFDETQTLLRNLLVYEYTWQKGRDLLSFIYLLNSLIYTAEDVRRMKESGVLKNNSLGSDEDVANMWNSMLSGYVIQPSRHYQLDVFDKIANHRKKIIPSSLGTLKIFYNEQWKIPWTVWGLLAAFVTIVATIVATVYTIVTYYYGNKQRAQT